MKRTVALAIFSTALAACAGSSEVMTVDGVVFDLDDIPITTEDPTIEFDIFRNTLFWVIADQVLTEAAFDQFAITFSEQEVRAAAEASLALGDTTDPRANLAFFEIQARFGPQGLAWGEVSDQLPEGLLPIEWALEQLRAADVEVAPKYGEWRVIPEPAVYAP